MIEPLFPGERRELPREPRRTRDFARAEGTPLWQALDEATATQERQAAPQGDLFATTTTETRPEA